MTTYYVQCGEFTCPTGSFRGHGKLRWHGARWNPVVPITGRRKQLAGRLFVGLFVDDKPKWKPKDVIAIVEKVRTKQTNDPSASFVSQKGIYKHKVGGKVVHEDSVQVIVMDTAGVGQKEFEKQLIELGEKIAKKLDQETVVGELQVDGVTKKSWYISP